MPISTAQDLFFRADSPRVCFCPRLPWTVSVLCSKGLSFLFFFRRDTNCVVRDHQIRNCNTHDCEPGYENWWKKTCTELSHATYKLLLEPDRKSERTFNLSPRLKFDLQFLMFFREAARLQKSVLPKSTRTSLHFTNPTTRWHWLSPSFLL